jgi:hypothetical protein
MNKYISKIKQLLSMVSKILSNILNWTVGLCTIIFSAKCFITSSRTLYNNFILQNKELSFSNLLIYILMISVTTLCIILLLKLINTTINRLKKFMGTKTKNILFYIIFSLFMFLNISIFLLYAYALFNNELNITTSFVIYIIVGILIYLIVPTLSIKALKRNNKTLALRYTYIFFVINLIYSAILGAYINYCGCEPMPDNAVVIDQLKKTSNHIPSDN